MDMQCIRVNNLSRITEHLNSLTFSTGTLVLPSFLMVVSHRVHVVEQNGETRRTVLNGKYTHSPRTLRHRGVKDDERRVSHDRKENEEEGKKNKYLQQ